MSHTCNFVHNLVKGGPEMTFADFQTRIQGAEKFTDGQFPTSQALQWTDKPFQGSGLQSNVLWERLAQNNTKDSGYSLWGSQGAHPGDIKQGSIGNCWFMAAASAVAEEPDALEQVFYNDDINDAGLYAVKLYPLGFPVTMVVDDYLPYGSWWGDDRFLIFGGEGTDKSMWGALIEKAIAKFLGAYTTVAGGLTEKGINMLVGDPFQSFYHSGSDAVSKDTLWNTILDRLHNERVMMGSGSHFTQTGSDQDQNANGISFNHAYTLLGAYVLSDGTKLLKVRNPWRSENYTGPWSDSSNNWNDTFKAEVGYVNSDDGIFFIDLDTYYTDFYETTFNFATQGLEHNWYAKFGDTGSDGSQGTYGWCSSQCRKRGFTLNSNHSQMVIITLQSWDKKTYPASCRGNEGGGLNLEVTGEQFVQYTNYGSVTVIKNVAAGETIDISTTIDLSRQNFTNDWALHVYSEHPVGFDRASNVADSDAIPFSAW